MRRKRTRLRKRKPMQLTKAPCTPPLLLNQARKSSIGNAKPFRLAPLNRLPSPSLQMTTQYFFPVKRVRRARVVLATIIRATPPALVATLEHAFSAPIGAETAGTVASAGIIAVAARIVEVAGVSIGVRVSIVAITAATQVLLVVHNSSPRCSSPGRT